MRRARARISQRRSSLYWVICFNSTAHGTDQKWHAQWPKLTLRYICKLKGRRWRTLASRVSRCMNLCLGWEICVYTLGWDIFQLSPSFSVAWTFIYIPNCGTRSGNINVLAARTKVSEAFILPRSHTHWAFDSELREGKHIEKVMHVRDTIWYSDG
jgi:hypothetical protein